MKDKPLIDGKLYTKVKTTVSVADSDVKEGRGALRWDYAMERGGTTAIYLNLDIPIPGDPQRLGMWVMGDGKGQWLRGVLQDKDGEKFLVDWTGSGGVYWKDHSRARLV